jgi:tyrosyl-tRNA synthetase
LAAGIGVLSLFVRAGLKASNGEARRQIQGGGLRVDDEVVTDERALVARDAPGAVVKLSVGRKKHALVKAV